MTKTMEKKLILIHVVLFVVCAVCRIYCQMHIDEWKYNFQMGFLYWPTLIFAKPLYYYSAGFLASFFLARKAFRDDLNLPYKSLGIMAVVLLVLYVLIAGILLKITMFGTLVSALAMFCSYSLRTILEYNWILCIPGILFGLVAERRWKE